MADNPLHYQAIEMDEGTGTRRKRLFPVEGLPYIDPFVLFDEFFLAPGAGFPEHAHRGFDAVCYLFSGALHHRDNLGNDGLVSAGSAQVFTTGRGITHAEASVGATPAHGIQLWINTARIHKGLPATYQQVTMTQLPSQTLPCGSVRTIIGPGSPIHLHTSTLYHDVQLECDGEYHLAVPAHHIGLLYAVAGELDVVGDKLAAGSARLLSGASLVTIYAERACRFISISAQPHGGPIVLHGGYVD